ncbi:sugar nucleotide-binding protein [Sphingopyxis sp. Geo48]|nr:sugar nucleotide-binding protein [Sphingopyxis sp. Geo48]
MTRDRYLVVGANGELGQALLRELGPERAIAATRKADTPLPGFEHVRIGQDGTPPAGTLARCAAVINAAGSATGDKPTLQSANIDLPRAIAHAAKDAGVPRLVQVSSFSILGAAEHIDDRTVERPINAYGRSKAAAEHVLLGNSDDAFSVECVRLPFLFSAAKPSLLAPLLSLATRLRHLPAASGHPVRRSMITYADAARQLANAARSGTGGISFAADPRLFDYDLLGVVLVEEARMRLRIVSLPRIVVAGADRLFPAIGRRLFRSSVLDPRANRAGNQPLGLEDELRKLVRSTYGS